MTDLERRLYAELKWLARAFREAVSPHIPEEMMRITLRGADALIREYEAKAEAEAREVVEP